MDLDDEEADLQRALALSRDDAPPTAPTPPPEPVAADVTVLTDTDQVPHHSRAAVGNLSLEATARAPSSSLPQYYQRLLRRRDARDAAAAPRRGRWQLRHAVADFVDDGQCAAWLASAAGSPRTGQELPRLFARGPLAACFVPRWVRGALVIDPMLPEASLQIAVAALSAPTCCCGREPTTLRRRLPRTATATSRRHSRT